ncbi:hypothetical protein G7Y89_g3151 [Cudoniella acicularis]|uniref:Pentacotripeptide-repeat region of PRORP domain-containing protein n=1 Tax=Cudoniella acicularis TaxID=354080 RepID=A0A8H4RRX2_9HELO|nr:hypothetical protein G7Y89_g3151 [Cudoniella acicularis]
MPASSKASKSRRALHSAFWNHAAGDVELPPLWAALVRGIDSVGQREERIPEQKAPTGGGSLFLDFLYPASTFNFLRHYSTWGSDKQDGRWMKSGFAKFGQRSYTSSASDTIPMTIEAVSLDDKGESNPCTDEQSLYQLRQKWSLVKNDDYDEAWRQYSLLDDSDKKGVLRLLILYYSTSHRVLDAERTVDLFEALTDKERNRMVYRNTIRAHLRLHNVQDALRLHASAKEVLQEPTAADELLAYLMDISYWSQASMVWSGARKYFVPGSSNVGHDIFNIVEKFDNFQDLACQLARYAAHEKAKASGSEVEDPESVFYNDSGALRAEIEEPAHELTDAPIEIETGEPEALAAEIKQPASISNDQSEAVTEAETGESEAFRAEMEQSASTSNDHSEALIETEATEPEALAVEIGKSASVFDDQSEAPKETETTEPEALAAEMGNPASVFDDQSEALKETDTGKSASFSHEQPGSLIETEIGEAATVSYNQAEVLRTKMDESVSIPELVEFATAVTKVAIFKRSSFQAPRFYLLLHYLYEFGALTPKRFHGLVSMLDFLGENRIMIRWYKKLRQDPAFKFTRSTLNSLMRLFHHRHSILGIRKVLDDFFRLHKHPTERAYKLALTEFANQGDAENVHKLFDQFLGVYYPNRKPLPNSDYLTPLLHVHAKRGEIAEVIERFDEITEKYGLQPSIMCWNILIDAYGKLDQVDDAFACFEMLLESTTIKPSHYTIGTLMGIATTRGDIDRVLDLLQLAEHLEIKKSAAMFDCLVTSYIQEGDLEKAEMVCEEAVSEDILGSRTRMWNSLIVAHAQRRDLKAANRVLQRMSKLKIDHDSYTYAALMQALAIVGQPDKAQAILRHVLPKAGIEATSFHYAVVMGGYVQTKEPEKIFSLHRSVASKSASTNAMLLRAVMQADQNLLEQGTRGEKFNRSLAMFLETAFNPKELSEPAKKGIARLPLDITYSTSLHSYAMYILSKNSEFDSVETLYARYKSSLPKDKQAMRPIKILSALLELKWQQYDYDGVTACWNLAKARAIEAGQGLLLQPSDGTNQRNIMRSHQLDLAKLLSTYLRSLAEQGKADAMILAVDDYIKNGFILDIHNWNTYVQLLCQKSRIKLAFQICESRLMPGFTGWSRIRQKLPVRNKLPIEIRNLRKNPRHLRPWQRTIFRLGKSYLDLLEAATESPGYQALLEDLQYQCPKVVRAIETMKKQMTRGQTEQVIGRRY